VPQGKKRDIGACICRIATIIYRAMKEQGGERERRLGGIRNLRPREASHVQYTVCPRGCYDRSDECSTSRVLNEKVVAAVGIKLVIVLAMNKQLVIRVMRVE
jgi:hypothetical protein